MEKGKALFAQKNYDDAVTALRKAADYSQALDVRADGYYTAGECFSAKSDYKDAIIEYTKCVVLGENPFRADSMLNIAESYVSLGEKDKAALAYKDYLGAYPDGPNAPKAKEALKKLEG